MIPLGHVLERVGVHEHEVVDEGQRLAHEHGAGGAAHGRRPLSGGLGTRPERDDRQRAVSRSEG